MRKRSSLQRCKTGWITRPRVGTSDSKGARVQENEGARGHENEGARGHECRKFGMRKRMKLKGRAKSVAYRKRYSLLCRQSDNLIPIPNKLFDHIMSFYRVLDNDTPNLIKRLSIFNYLFVLVF